MLSALKLPGVRWILSLNAADLALEYASSIALMVLVYDATSSPIAAAAMLVAKQVVPGVLLAALGHWLEPVDPRRGLAAAYVLRGAAFLLLAAAAHGVALYFLALGAGLAGTSARVFIRTTVVRGTAGPLFRSVTAAQNLLLGAMTLIGPAIGALASGGLGAGPSMFLWAGAALGLAGVVQSLPRALLVSRASESDPHDAESRPAGAGAEPREGVSVGGLLALAGLLVCVFSMDEPALLAYVRGGLGGDAGTYGLILMVWGAGIMSGGALYARFGVHATVTAIVLGVAASAAGYIGLGFAPTVAFALVAAFIGGNGNGAYWVAIVTTVLEACPPGEEARASGRLEGLGTAMPAVGIVLGGVMAELASPRMTLWLPGLVALVALAVWTVGVRAAAGRAAVELGGSHAGASAAAPVAGATPAEVLA